MTYTTNASWLAGLGWEAFFAEAFEPYASQGMTRARVALEYNRFYRIYAEPGEVTAELTGRMRHEAASKAALPAVGDWVAVRTRPDEGTATIHAVLPRKSTFSRKVAGRVAGEQVVAANVDTVFLVSALDQELNLRRIERYLTVAWESGARPVILLNKADLGENVEARGRAVQGIAGDAPVHVVSSRHGHGLADVRSYLIPGDTIAVLGSSGVGKSTLINRFLGTDLLATSEVRSKDNKGRHTTTHRELFMLPSGALLIDTPGMRELQLWEVSEGLQASFSDVEELADACYFPNCRHDTEPGCAVREAIEAGSLAAERYENWRKLQEEISYLAARQERRAQHPDPQHARAATRLAHRPPPRR